MNSSTESAYYTIPGKYMYVGDSSISRNVLFPRMNLKRKEKNVVLLDGLQ